ncbi:MAG: phosphohydrolase [Actinobacteria bacterium]|nr:phosphohydrolase [Actinomycetota bacterium]
MLGKCPGSDMRNITAGVYTCQNCGYAVEIFSDEARRRCPQCKEWVEKEETPSCVQWCKSARSCLGEERWKAVIDALGKAPED